MMKTALKVSLFIFGVSGIARLIPSVAWLAFSHNLFDQLPRHFRNHLNAILLLSAATAICAGVGYFLEARHPATRSQDTTRSYIALRTCLIRATFNL
jgi:hypothetical protein